MFYINGVIVLNVLCVWLLIFFSMLYIISLHKHTKIYLLVLLLMNIWVFPVFAQCSCEHSSECILVNIFAHFFFLSLYLGLGYWVIRYIYIYIFNIAVTAEYSSKFMLPLAVDASSYCCTSLSILCVCHLFFFSIQPSIFRAS